jgi:hypothetical protein
MTFNGTKDDLNVEKAYLPPKQLPKLKINFYNSIQFLLFLK